MSNGFTGRVTLVTGAGSGIGKAMAAAFARAGARVAVADVDRAGAQLTASEIGEAATAFAVDMSDESSVDELVRRAIDSLGRIDVLCNNAGILDKMSLPADTSIAEWERVLRVNLTGTFLVTRAVLPQMLEHGSGAIVNTASEAGIRGGAAGAPYTASKHGVVGLTRSVAWAYANDGIRCNAIVPGPVFSNAAGSVAGFDEKGVERLRPVIALNQHVALPEQIAEAAVFLASDAASFINGAIVPVDAGWSAG
ncbi:3-ketoacyl-ACP reductase [Mycobacterium alsense]|uniref:3-ketoacyl-ACP reductase n=1 Tax=Mycobacterium alsense TaxID=324058 RepID=A0ABD6P5Y0_9MYCO|nr:SDR family oxidoreductase [Mycobacterium alsense]OBG41330.1 3-ketoacyl-ACP reductase [Mycobacterium alsense]